MHQPGLATPLRWWPSAAPGPTRRFGCAVGGPEEVAHQRISKQREQALSTQSSHTYCCNPLLCSTLSLVQQLVVRHTARPAQALGISSCGLPALLNTQCERGAGGRCSTGAVCVDYTLRTSPSMRCAASWPIMVSKWTLEQPSGGMPSAAKGVENVAFSLAMI